MDRLPSSESVHLTPRELEILNLVAQGLPNRQIAHRLGITTGTVDSHLWNLYSKLGVTNRMQAIRVGTRHGLIDTDPQGA